MQVSATTEFLPSISRSELKLFANSELVNYVLTRFHEVHRKQFPEAIYLARRVEDAHGGSADCPEGLSEHLSIMFQELESHMMKEEQILFPMLVNDSYPQGPIMVMESEHKDHEIALQHILSLTNDLTLPPEACKTWRALYELMNEIIEDIREHIEIENNILFVTKESRNGQCCGGCGG